MERTSHWRPETTKTYPKTIVSQGQSPDWNSHLKTILEAGAGVQSRAEGARALPRSLHSRAGIARIESATRVTGRLVLSGLSDRRRQISALTRKGSHHDESSTAAQTGVCFGWRLAHDGAGRRARPAAAGGQSRAAFRVW